MFRKSLLVVFITVLTLGSTFPAQASWLNFSKPQTLPSSQSSIAPPLPAPQPLKPADESGYKALPMPADESGYKAIPTPATSGNETGYRKYMIGLDMIAATMAKLAYTRDDCSAGNAQKIQDQLLAKFALSSGTMWTRVIYQKENQVQAVIYANKALVVVAFRGSCGKDAGTYNVAGVSTPIARPENSPNWKMNYNGASNVDESGFNGKATHRGWAHATNVQLGGGKNFYEEVAQWTRVALESKESGKYLIITGHSMGGAMAHYFAYRFLDANKPWVPKAFTDPKQGRFVRTRILTFGAPKAGYGVCGEDVLNVSIEADYNRLLSDRQAWAASVEIPGDSVVDQTSTSKVCPRTMGNRIVGTNSMGSDKHNINNYMWIFARNMQAAYGKLPYSNMNDPLGSWSEVIVP